MNILTDMDAPNWLSDSIILLVKAGSYAYGTNIESSDKDFKGICIPPESYYLGLNAFSEYNSADGKNFKNTNENTDITIMHINKFVKNAAAGIPNCLEMLFVREEDILQVDKYGQVLIDNRKMFLSKDIYKKIAGFANSQIKKMKESYEKQTGRVDIINKYGYDTKYFMHAVRLLTTAIEIFDKEDFCTFRYNNELLLKCRNGKYNYVEATKMLEAYDMKMKETCIKSNLRECVDIQKINNLLININKSAIEEVKNGNKRRA